ncbi:MAG: glycosyltransferase family 4 protein [Sphingomonas sp.]|uniref:glycosyltransferase family 4 protein n=1 Tax=Sphingomonas sp. TaxID=28214 RepID=UPI0017E39937|nr:glycosyltransferase family 1 protein [Sphingomonas sp.]MBA3668064.1 glycosyltransferase family 4 protein [Sphingomonas sp.]
MKPSKHDLARLVIDIAPMREEQFTGIPNVVKEVALRALAVPALDLAIEFAVGDNLIDREIVAATVAASSGRPLNQALRTSAGVRPLSMSDLGPTAGLNLHIKPPFRRFAIEALFFHDLSFLSIPKVHQAGTLRAHLNGFRAQVDSTDIFFTNSNATKLDLEWYCGVPDAKIHVTHLGHDIETSSVAAMRCRIGSGAEPFLLVLGTIEPRKNIAFVLEWLVANRAVLDEYRVVFCGREGWGDSFDELVGSAGLVDALERGRLKHVGFVNADQRLALLVSAQALIFPSLYEGFGLPGLEAMACGTPVLASCSTSIPEVVGPDGLYFDPLNPFSLTKVFERFCKEKKDGRLEKRLARLSHRSTEFSYDTMFRSMVATIKSHCILRGKPPPQ